MGLTGHRRTSSHKRRRASHFALKKAVLAACSHCRQPVLPHRVCPNCGYYKGREVVKMVTALDKLAGKSPKSKEAEAAKK